MNDAQAPRAPERGPSERSEAPALAWLVHARRLVNVVFPAFVGYVIVLGALPRDMLEAEAQARHDRIVEYMRTVSLSQTWAMYAPNPGRGHFYMTLKALDEDGTERELEESIMARVGWGTARFWRRSRLDIWQHAVTRRIDKANRNRTWYLRGVCLREARRGYQVRRLEMARVYRGMRSPERVREGKDVLGPAKTTKAQDGSCRVQIIRDMIAVDAQLRAARGEGG